LALAELTATPRCRRLFELFVSPTSTSIFFHPFPSFYTPGEMVASEESPLLPSPPDTEANELEIGGEKRPSLLVVYCGFIGMSRLFGDIQCVPS
jgi:hypothetical protein